MDDSMNMKWPTDRDRGDELFEMTLRCRQALRACEKLGVYLVRQNDERLATVVKGYSRHVKICRHMEKMLMNQESYHPDELRAAMEDFGLEVPVNWL